MLQPNRKEKNITLDQLLEISLNIVKNRP